MPVAELVTVKSREVQRAMLAEMRGDREEMSKHFLAAAHLELVLADDYQQAGETESACRSRISAASCFWRGGQPNRAREVLDDVVHADPPRAAEVHEVLRELTTEYPLPT
jgi:hypothetical protein